MSYGFHTPLRRVGFVALALLMSACAGQAPLVTGTGPSVQQLLDGSLVGIEDTALAEPAPILRLNDDMRNFVRLHIPEDAGSRRKVELILAAILDDGLRLDYNLFETHTAEEAFYSREGNCMSFTNLFIALARHAGVTVYYQEVEVPPSWGVRGNTWMYNKHLNALVDLPGGSIAVDFALDNYDSEYRRRQISDSAAQARYHNNMGVHWLAENDLPAAYRHFVKAVQLEPKTAYFWTNLGTLYRRFQRDDAAERAFAKAIDLGNEPAAMSNLARLYQDQGRIDVAAWYEDRVQLFRRKNPYYLFHLAEEAYAAADYEAAAHEARAAIRRQKGEHEFHRLLGMSYVQLGELEKAEKHFATAAELAANPELRQTYERKMEMLARH